MYPVLIPRDLYSATLLCIIATNGVTTTTIADE